jgi:hypothetical protein
MMTRQLALGAKLASALFLTPAMTMVVEAQTNVTMAAGEEKEVCTGVKAAVTPAPKAGELRTDGDPKGETTVRIFYKAKDTANVIIESLTCAADGKQTAVNVAVAPKRSSVSGFSEEAYPEAFKALFLLFVVAIVLESALAILFNWRPFVETFNARAVRPLVSMAFALALVHLFKMDLVTSLAKLISPNVPALDGTGRLLTAMVIAGGSAAVNNLMVGLGFRQQRTPDTATPRPPRDVGWISVAIERTATIKGPVTVAIGVANGAGQVPVVASLNGTTSPGYRYFFRDRGRFPGSGGYSVAKGDNVTVKVGAAKEDGTGTLEKTWGPHVIADGAIVDLSFRME